LPSVGLGRIRGCSCGARVQTSLMVGTESSRSDWTLDDAPSGAWCAERSIRGNKAKETGKVAKVYEWGGQSPVEAPAPIEPDRRLTPP
jgi:hypothetical protein